MTDPAQIAGHLSDAKRRWILASVERNGEVILLPRVGKNKVSRPMVRGIEKLGLCAGTWPPDLRLTTLGLAVRAELEKMDG